MSEELNNQNSVEPQVEAPANVPTTESAPQAETQSAAPVEPAATEPASESIPAAEPAPQPQVIVQQVCVLCIAFYFMPGIAITFAISLIPGISLGAIAAWTFSAIFSIIAWVIFKLKIKGFKKSFYFYIGLCVLVFILLTVIEVLTEETNVFSKIFSMLCGAGA